MNTLISLGRKSVQTQRTNGVLSDSGKSNAAPRGLSVQLGDSDAGTNGKVTGVREVCSPIKRIRETSKSSLVRPEVFVAPNKRFGSVANTRSLLRSEPSGFGIEVKDRVAVPRTVSYPKSLAEALAVSVAGPNCSATLPKDRPAPPSGRIAPTLKNSVVAPKDCGATTNGFWATPKRCATAPESCGRTKERCGSATQSSGSASKSCGTTPNNCGTTTPSSATARQRVGTAPSGSVVIPEGFRSFIAGCEDFLVDYRPASVNFTIFFVTLLRVIRLLIRILLGHFFPGLVRFSIALLVYYFFQKIL